MKKFEPDRKFMKALFTAVQVEAFGRRYDDPAVRPMIELAYVVGDISADQAMQSALHSSCTNNSIYARHLRDAVEAARPYLSPTVLAALQALQSFLSTDGHAYEEAISFLQEYQLEPYKSKTEERV